MFADSIDTSTTETLSIPWWVTTGGTLVALAVVAFLVWRLRRPITVATRSAVGAVAAQAQRLLVKRTGASPAPPPVEAQELRAPQGASLEASTPAPQGEAPAWLPRALVVIASVPTVLALPWAAWAVSQHLPVPAAVALPLGVLFDVAMVGAVLVALLVPSVSRQASMLGWAAALTAAAAIAAYTGVSAAVIFAATPLISKALWGLLVTIRRQQASLRASHVEALRRQREAQAQREAEEERKAAELSTDLDHQQAAEIARLEREALYEERLAAAQLKLELAKSDAEHQRALAEIRRLGEQQREEDREAAGVYEQRIRLERQLKALRGEAPAFLVAAGDVAGTELVPEITAKTSTSAPAPMGFGFSRPLDVRALTPEGAAVRFEELPETHQALVRYVHAEKKPTIRGASRKLDRDARTIRRWKDKLSEQGYDLPIGD
ncbi:hypothetical protein [Marinitenerispora sediminis]|uniref:Uncharacterized protein n=1 Tax=Marinitenerispora sediminis TaxID=1931232 RepID=A0A368T6H5_9ACTN|nr:hypothetical protein [Marinitenerispora sediminis]RCV59276.1 hypothetical protein DEF24_09900 [Marinitenerispora sediminis]